MMMVDLTLAFTVGCSKPAEAPAEVPVTGPEPNPQWQSHIKDVPHFLEWNLVGGSGEIIHLGACHMSPGHTYFVQALLDGWDAAAEANYSVALALPTSGLWSDVAGSGNPSTPPDGVANFVDIQAVLLGFQAVQITPKVWLELEGTGDSFNVPDFSVINFSDVLRAVQGFQGLPYPFADPCTCAGSAPCP